MITKEQVIDLANNTDFLISIIAVLLIILVFFFLSRIGRKKPFDKETFYSDVISINKNIQNSQKENIAAQKKLNNLYKMFKKVEGQLLK